MDPLADELGEAVWKGKADQGSQCGRSRSPALIGMVFAIDWPPARDRTEATVGSASPAELPRNYAGGIGGNPPSGRPAGSTPECATPGRCAGRSRWRRPARGPRSCGRGWRRAARRCGCSAQGAGRSASWTPRRPPAVAPPVPVGSAHRAAARNDYPQLRPHPPAARRVRCRRRRSPRASARPHRALR